MCYWKGKGWGDWQSEEKVRLWQQEETCVVTYGPPANADLFSQPQHWPVSKPTVLELMTQTGFYLPRVNLEWVSASFVHTHTDIKQMSQLREREFRRAESSFFSTTFLPFPPIFCFSTYLLKSRTFPGSVVIKVLVCNYTESWESWLNGERGF